MSATKQVPDGIDVPDGWVCEIHTRRNDALVWFSPPVVQVFTDYDSRHDLTNAVGDEINTIPSDHIPYGMLFFNEKPFVYSAFWFEEENYWVIEVNLAAELKLEEYELDEMMAQFEESVQSM